MSDVERELMINKINNKKKNPKLMETFFNLNGVNASEEELDVLQDTMDNGLEMNVDLVENTSLSSVKSENETGSSHSTTSLGLTGSVSEI